MDNFFGFRFAIILILLITLGSSITSANNTQSLLSPMILFLLPLALDYFSHNPKQGKNIIRKNVGIWMPLIIAALIIGVLLTQLNLDFLTTFFWVKLLIWLPFIFFGVLAGIDWAAYSNPIEKEHRELVKRVVRSEVFDPPQKRVKQYHKEKKREFEANEEYL